MSKCIKCGKEGPHYVPPSLGEPGFFVCDPTEVSFNPPPPPPSPLEGLSLEDAVREIANSHAREFGYTKTCRCRWCVAYRLTRKD